MDQHININPPATPKDARKATEEQRKTHGTAWLPGWRLGRARIAWISASNRRRDI